MTSATDPDPSGITATFQAAELVDVPGFRNVSATTLAALTDTEDGDAVVLKVRPHQVAGLFQFTTAELRAAEGASLTLTITRLHGSRGNVALRVATVDETAYGGEDYVALDTVVRFRDGDTQRTVQVQLTEDGVEEAHFETFHVQLSMYVCVRRTTHAPERACTPAGPRAHTSWLLLRVVVRGCFFFFFFFFFFFVGWRLAPQL